jgi:hypothetical protein
MTVARNSEGVVGILIDEALMYKDVVCLSRSFDEKERRIQMAVEKHFSPRDPRARTNAGAAALLDGWDAADNAAEM